MSPALGPKVKGRTNGAKNNALNAGDPCRCGLLEGLIGGVRMTRAEVTLKVRDYIMRPTACRI